MKELLDIAKGTGASVELIDTNVLGRCDYKNKIIYIAKGNDKVKSAMILAHELGHWLTFLENKKNTSIQRNDRERLAYERGWYLLANTGLAYKYHISKEDWYALNLLNFHNFDPDTKMAWT